MSTKAAIYRKTVKGEQEIAKRILNLPIKVRSVLIAVDGKRDAEDLAKSFAALGSVSAMLTELEQKGCIEAVPGAVSAKTTAHDPAAVLSPAAKQYATEFLYDLLGPESEDLIRRFEKCRSNEELARMFDEGRDMLSGIGRPKKSEEFWKRGQELLSS